MQKFFINDNQIIEEKAIITGEDVRHISNVLRMKVGEELQIGNKQKVESYIAEIERIEKDKVIAKLIEKCSIKNEPNVDIDLYQGLPKADKMEWIIQKTTEVGVNKIIPVEMTRCIVKLDEKDAIKKITRWQKVAEGAAKQSKRDKIPVIENKIKLPELKEKIKEYDAFFIAYEEEETNKLKEELKKIENKEFYKIAVLIGPEGGLEKNEVNDLKKDGAKVVTLGKRILRTETAPIVIVSNILYELEK